MCPHRQTRRAEKRDPVATPEIDQVLADLDRIIDDSRRAKSRIGFFAAIYRQVTLRVQQGIEADEFEDGPRMDLLDAIFAKRYMDAVAAWKSKGQPTRSWRTSFDAAEARDRRLILQHLLLGMNAHINLDLGVAAAEVAPGDSIDGLKRDFDHINVILNEMLDGAQKAIGKHSPMVHILNQVGGAVGDQILGFSFPVARFAAWMNALVLARQSGKEKESTIDMMDRRAALAALPIVDPGGVVGKSIESTIILAETQDVVPVIDTLNSIITPGAAPKPISKPTDSSLFSSPPSFP
jgi:Family of unknown function (DUF5995)